MKQKDKELLLKDLGARLTYGVKVTWDRWSGYSITLTPSIYVELWKEEKDQNIPKVYLRPMSSMTEEECYDFMKLGGLINIDYDYRVWRLTPDSLDFLLSHHLDYSGLIEKGLALEAPEEMYKIEQNLYGEN